MLILAAIMAHNEEAVISNCIYSLISQNLKNKFSLEINIVLNACTDRTEEIVNRLSKNNKAVIVHKLKKKGKVNAINYFKKLVSEDRRKIIGLLFMDADVTFKDNNVLYKIANKLILNNDILLISPHNVAKIDHNKRFSVTYKIYKTKNKFRNLLKGISFSGMCYLIRPEISAKIDIPEYIIAEDRFISEKLRGGIYEDWSCNYYSHVPQKLSTEIKRILRHSLANKQLNNLYRLPGFTSGVVEKPKYFGDGSWNNKNRMLKCFFELDSFEKIIIMLTFFISKFGDLRAKILFKRLGVKSKYYNIDFWKVNR